MDVKSLQLVSIPFCYYWLLIYNHFGVLKLLTWISLFEMPTAEKFHSSHIPCGKVRRGKSTAV